MSSPAPDPVGRRPLAPRAVASTVVAVLVVDQATKSWAVGALDDGRVIDVVGSLRFALGFNSGFAFGHAGAFGRVIGVVALVASVLIAIASVRARSRAASAGYALVAAGAAGNVVDRLFRGEKWMAGKVVDFIDLQWWPVFNVADSAITVGAVLVVAAGLWEGRRGAETTA